jgi:3-dehydroquinate dehydratase
MGVMSAHDHEFWATVSGGPLEELIRQETVTWRWGVAAIEFRADLISSPVFDELLAEKNRDGGWLAPTFVAHFGTGAQSDDARRAINRALEAGVAGGICHSHCELIDEIQAACLAADRRFVAAYHSQQPMTADEAVAEFARQELRRPLLRKIAVRAYEAADVLALLQATQVAANDGGSPVVAAVFGPLRWARVALPHAGSAISFLVAGPATNEVGGDDEQLQLAEVDQIQTVRGLYPQRDDQPSRETSIRLAATSVTGT